MNPRIPGAIALLLLVTFIPSPARASEEGARFRARQLFNTLVNYGWKVRDFYRVGLLRDGQSEVIQTTLYAGNEYKLVAAGCEDAYDVDIRLYDSDGDLINRDNDTEQLAVVDWTPPYTGTYYIKVTMYRSTSNGAHFVLQYAYK